jgi:hypothetical protein
MSIKPEAPRDLGAEHLDEAVGGAAIGPLTPPRGNLQIADLTATGTPLASVTDLIIDPFNPSRL